MDRWCEQLTVDIQECERQVSDLQSQQATTAAEARLMHLADQQRAARQSSQELSEEAGGLQERIKQAQERRGVAEAEGEELRGQGEALGQEIEAARRTGVAQMEVDALRARQVNAHDGMKRVRYLYNGSYKGTPPRRPTTTTIGATTG